MNLDVSTGIQLVFLRKPKLINFNGEHTYTHTHIRWVVVVHGTSWVAKTVAPERDRITAADAPANHGESRANVIYISLLHHSITSISNHPDVVFVT